MEPIKTAVENAMQFARDTLGAGRTAEMRLEEVESESIAGKDAWLITLSMINTEGPLGPINAVASSLGADAKREYKVFTVAKDNGDVTAMRIREFATT